MKKLFSILSVITLVLFFASCSSDSSKKTLKPESLEFTSGTLGQHFKIVDEPAELTMVKKDQTYFFRLEVKCQKTTDDFAGMDPAEINTSRFRLVGTVELLDENKIQCSRSLVLYLDPASMDKLVVSKKGAVSVLVFEYNLSDEDAPDWFDDAVYFSPYAVADFSLKEEKTEEVASTPSHLAMIKAEDIKLPSELKDVVEVVPEDDGYVYMDFDQYYYPTLSITFKLLKNISTASLCSQGGQMWIVGHAQDEKGRNIDDLNPKSISSREWRASDSDGSLFKTFLEGEVGETITMDFTGENNIELFEEDEAKKEEGKKKTTEAAAKCKRFKLSLTK